MKHVIFLFFAILFLGNIVAQTDSAYLQLKEKVIRNIDWLSYYNAWTMPDTVPDPWNLATTISKKLSLLLTYDESRDLDLNQFPGLKLQAQSKDEHQLRLYNFGFDCGGTAGYIDYPVLQWQNSKGKNFAFDLSSYMNMGFDSTIYLLSEDSVSSVYLLLAEEQWCGACFSEVAIVLRITDNYIFTNYPAFAGYSNLYFDQVSLKFDPSTNILDLSNTPWLSSTMEIQGDIFADVDLHNTALNQHMNYYLLHKLEGEVSLHHDIYLWYDGNKFINITKRID